MVVVCTVHGVGIGWVIVVGLKICTYQNYHKFHGMFEDRCDFCEVADDPLEVHEWRLALEVLVKVFSDGQMQCCHSYS